MLELNQKESEFYQRFLELKSEAGNHSPSIFRLLSEFPEVSMTVDACFLCNPYAFESFYTKFLEADLEPYIKFYPPQNEEVAVKIAEFSGAPADQILVGNGAIELIEVIMNLYAGKRVCMTLPSFSTYYEIAEQISECHYYVLAKETGFDLDVNAYMDWIKEVNPDVVVIVNPNNPTGTIVSRENIIAIWNSLRPDQTLIVDESFIHFAPGDESIESISANAENLIIIRSLSKDFGIAGLRVGYSVMPKKLKDQLLKRGFLWNSNGLAYFFTTVLSEPTFQKEYKRVRDKYNRDRDKFYKDLLTIDQIKVIPSNANFFMIETQEDPGILFSKLLYNWGIYTRILNDKAGLKGNFLRVASKDQRENRKIINAFQKIYNGK